MICRTSIIVFWPSSIHNISEGRWINSDRTTTKEVQGRHYGRPSRIEVIRRDGVIRNHQKRLNLDSVTRSHQIWIHQKSSEVLQDESQFAIICRENCHRRSAILWTPSTCVSIICMCLSIYANFLLLTYISQITREHLLQSLYILCYSATCFPICKLLFLSC